MLKFKAREMAARSKRKGLSIPSNWSWNDNIAAHFDTHVRRELCWYELATSAVTHVARCFVPQAGTVIDVGASTGNIGRAIAPILKARQADLIAIDNSPAMRKAYAGPGCFEAADVVTYDFSKPRPDVVICFLSLMFVPVKHRQGVMSRMRQALNPGGAVIVVDKIVPRAGYVGTVNYRMTLAAKHEAGATPQEIVKKELSIAGLQRPMAESELNGFCEFFRFGDFAGYVWEKGV